MSERRSQRQLSRSTGALRAHFDRVAVISLARRHDRRERLTLHLNSLALAGTQDITWQDAVDGNACNTPPPAGWSAGPGAWGCVLSHLQALREALRDGIQRLLILEDDVVFSPCTARALPLLMQALPPDWGQLYLGGQHLCDPRPSHSPLLWQAGNINRTHAWAAHRQWMPDIIAHLMQWVDYAGPRPDGSGWHLDHQLGAAHQQRRWPAFTSSWWLAGQEGDESDICGQALRRRWWHPRRYALQLPFVHVPQPIPPEAAEALLPAPEDEHFTHALKGDGYLLTWLHRIAAQALDYGCLPAWSSPLLPPDRVRQLWPAGLAPLPPSPPHYPFDGTFPHPLAAALLSVP